MKSLIKHFKKVNGQSLAEFAVTTAMMATLATTAAPKFSGVGEGAKEKKTLADIDKILKTANNFYNEQVTKAGRGRFPGQVKYNSPVPETGGYNYSTVQEEADYQVKLALQGILNSDGEVTTPPTFTQFDNDGDAQSWASVFGTNHPDSRLPDAANVSPGEDASTSYLDPTNTNKTIVPGTGAEEFLSGFGDNVIKSPFQDGHYIYTVIAGSGSGSQSVAPIMYVADLESPASFWKKLQP